MIDKLFNSALCVIAVLLAFAVLSIPLIDERCLACGEREDSHNLAVSLRKLSIIEWCYDYFSSGDLHINYYCPTKFENDNNARGVK